MYVVKCADGTLYTGYSPDVEARVAAHNAGKGAKYTKTRRPVELVGSAAFETKHEAMSAEWHFKQLSRAKKDELLARISAGEPFEDVLGSAFDLRLERSQKPASTCCPCELRVENLNVFPAVQASNRSNLQPVARVSRVA